MDAALQTAGLFVILSSLAGMLILCRLSRPRNRRRGTLSAWLARRLRTFSQACAYRTCSITRCTGERDE